MSSSRLYCRFCAEEKPYAEITALTSQDDQRTLTEKLSLIGISVDFSNKMLPQTACITCFGLIEVCHEFSLKVKRSQVVLGELCGVEVETEICYTFPSCEAVKEENEDFEYLQDVPITSFEDTQSLLKVEKYDNGETETLKKATKVLEQDLPSVETSTTRKTKKKQSWATYTWQCSVCGTNVDTLKDLREHCQDDHLRCFAFKCADCDGQLNDFDEFVAHVRRHRKVLRHICPYCNIQLNHEDSDHTKEHTTSHHCKTCGQNFQSKRQLRAHERITLIKPPKKRRKRPLPDRDSTCGICGMIMKTPASLKAHLRTHTDRKRNYTCDRCGKAYYTKGSLDVHHKIHESNVKEACKICHKTFLTIPRLKKHVKTHNLEMPYQCDHCKRFFNSKDRLREHVKVHMDVMPFQCQYCTKRFRHKSIMKTHENQHTGARPYSCNLCCMDFANWSNCNKHMKRKHGTTLAKNVMTPHGKLALNPQTGKPNQLFMDNVVKEWSEMMLMSRDRGKSLQVDPDRQLQCNKS